MPKQLPIPNVVPACTLRVIDDNDPLCAPKWKTLESIIYTPRAIQNALERHDLDSAWIAFAGANELWIKSASSRLAQRASG